MLQTFLVLRPLLPFPFFPFAAGISFSGEVIFFSATVSSLVFVLMGLLSKLGRSSLTGVEVSEERVECTPHVIIHA